MYVIEEHHEVIDGIIHDLVTEKWNADQSWVVGSRNRVSGTTTFRFRTYPSFAAVCDNFDIKQGVLKRRKLETVLKEIKERGEGNTVAMEPMDWDKPPAHCPRCGRGNNLSHICEWNLNGSELDDEADGKVDEYQCMDCDGASFFI